MKKIINKYGFKPKKDHFETPQGESVTVVGESYTIKEIIDKYANGIAPNVALTNVFPPYDPTHEDLDLESVNRMDMAERQNLSNLQLANVNRLQEKLSEQEAQKLQIAQSKEPKDEEGISPPKEGDDAGDDA